MVGGGGERIGRPSLSPPHFEKLAKCFRNLNFSLGQDNHECSDTVQES